VTSRLVPDAERRARMGLRHRLADPAAVPVDSAAVAGVVDGLVVLHATDPATIYLSISARLPGVGVDDVDRALFDDRTVFRTLAMRRTLFLTTPETAPVVEGSSSRAVAANERRRLVAYLTDAGIDGAEDLVEQVAAEVLAVLDRDEAAEGLSARELVAAVPRLGTRIVFGRGTRQETELSLTSRLLGLLAVEGRLIRGRPVGGWTNRLYRWHHRDRWWPEGRGPTAGLAEDEASAALVERYLATFGPATVDDLVWWTGWTKTKARRAVAGLDVVEVEVEPEGGAPGAPGLLLAADADAVDPDGVGPWAALLPALDPTPMGWKERAWFLGEHQGPLFDRSGNIGPTVWADGRIVGGWAQRPDGEVVVELLEDVGGDHRALIEAEAARVQRFVGETVVKPSFPTPLQRGLSAG
jgi:hypothetical protein